MLRMALILIFCVLATSCKEYPKEIDPIDISDTSETIPETDPEPTNPVCTQIMSSNDGANGFLWKPESDSGNALVILLPSKFVSEFESVEVIRANGEREQLRFTGFSNGDRQTWRGQLAGKKYQDRGLITASEFKQICTWKLAGKGGSRND